MVLVVDGVWLACTCATISRPPATTSEPAPTRWSRATWMRRPHRSTTRARRPITRARRRRSRRDRGGRAAVDRRRRPRGGRTRAGGVAHRARRPDPHRRGAAGRLERQRHPGVSSNSGISRGGAHADRPGGARGRRRPHERVERARRGVHRRPPAPGAGRGRHGARRAGRARRAARFRDRRGRPGAEPPREGAALPADHPEPGRGARDRRIHGVLRHARVRRHRAAAHQALLHRRHPEREGGDARRGLHRRATRGSSR